MRLDRPDRAVRERLRREAVEQQPDIDDIIDMPPHIDIRRAHRMRPAQVRFRKIVVEPRRFVRQAGMIGKGIIFRETGLFKPENFLFRPQNGPLRPAARDQLFPARQAVAAEAADIPPRAALRPCGRRQLDRKSVV